MHAQGLLPYVLSAIGGWRASVGAERAVEVELRCLEGLGWRLGPYFEGQELY
jgi:hypothetical protein